MNKPAGLARIEVFSLRAQVSEAPLSSLGEMAARNGLPVRIEDNYVAFGWGDIWCNFPPHGNESHKHLLDGVIAPELVGQWFSNVGDVRPHLEKK